MKNITLFLAGLSLSAASLTVHADRTIRLFDEVVFYDGYMDPAKNPDKDLQDGILRHRTSLYAVKLTDEQMDAFGSNVNMHVDVKACCDNYDRIGNINLALVPKGSETYDYNEVARMELGRFITPFMNKNKKPDTVPYDYWMDYLSPIMHDSDLRAEYDFWIEFELFGIPYAANKQVAGCADRNDVFYGTLEFVTSEPEAAMTDNNVLVPIQMKNPEYIGGNLNNYQEDACDEIGKCSKTWTFEVPEDVEDAQIVLITSNHGANAGGEEYNRRLHVVRVDGERMLMYKPGRTSCEPFRIYNTQGNGIYGPSPMSDYEWQSFSNWCPGDVIDNRIINLGPMKAGTHSVNIYVSRAEFVDQQGDIPVSMFFQGAKKGTLPSTAALEEVIVNHEYQSKVVLNGRNLHVEGGEALFFVEVYDTSGRLLAETKRDGNIDMSRHGAGVYVVFVEYANGLTESHKIIVK